MAFINIDTHSKNTGLVTVTLTTERKPFIFIIDTGSNVSHIDIEAAKLLTKSSEVPSENNSVTGISGALQSTGKIKQCFNSGIFTFDHEYFVTNLASLVKAVEADSNIKIHGILGTDFLVKYRCHLDFKKSRLHLG